MASNQQKKQTDNKQHTVEVKEAIFIKKFPVFLPPRPDHKYSHTNSHYLRRDQLELGPPVARVCFVNNGKIRAEKARSLTAKL